MNKTEKTIELKAPFFGLKKWRIERGLTSPEWEAYAKASSKVAIVIAILTYILGYVIAGGRL